MEVFTVGRGRNSSKGKLWFFAGSYIGDYFLAGHGDFMMSCFHFEVSRQTVIDIHFGKLIYSLSYQTLDEKIDSTHVSMPNVKPVSLA